MHKDLGNEDYVAWLRFLRRSDGWSRDQIAANDLAELRRVLKFAYENTTGYRDAFDRVGFHPGSLLHSDDIQQIPFLTKSMIRDDLDSFSADVPGRAYVTTGGSTGVPTGMYRDNATFAKELASKAHQYHRVGWLEGDRQMVFRGLQIETDDGMELIPEMSELRCSTYQFGTERMEAYRIEAFDYRPEWIRCYPSSGYVFARFLHDSGREFPPIKGMLCSSEQLYPFQRDLFHKVFGEDIRIFAHYGHYEMSALAGFCEYTDDYHVLPQYGFVELLDGDDKPVTTPGTVGEIVATSFIMKATPFIRYRTEDLAVYKSDGCDKCGRPYQVWERIEGRLQELIKTSTGRLISTSMLNMHDDSYDMMKQFQFHQREPESVVFRYVPKDGTGDDAATKAMSRIQEKLGSDIRLVMERVAEIPLTKRGKHRLLIQEMDLQLDHPALRKAISL